MKYFITLSLLLSVCYAQISYPILNSRPGAPITIFLDFDGHYVPINSYWGERNGAFYASPSTLPLDTMMGIYERVLEDFRPFNVNITTDSTVYANHPARLKQRVIIATKVSLAGYPGVSGLSFPGSYKGFYQYEEIEAWVLADKQLFKPKNIAEVVTHELGHCFGINHYDRTEKCAEVNTWTGIGEGETSWCPIMGMPYNKNLTTWAGPNPCYPIRDDMERLARAMPFVADDYPLPVLLQPVQTGVIERNIDYDEFEFTIGSPANVTFNATPNAYGPNLDIKLYLLNAFGDTLSINNPIDIISAKIDTTLSPGKYFIGIAGDSNRYMTKYGSVGKYTLKADVNVSLPYHKFTTKVEGNKITWKFDTDEQLSLIELEHSTDGLSFTKIKQTTSLSGVYTMLPVGEKNYYRLKAILVNGKEIYSLVMGSSNKMETKLLGTIVKNNLKIQTPDVLNFYITDVIGRIFLKRKIFSGVTDISVNTLAPGIYFAVFIKGESKNIIRFIKQ